MFSRDRSGFGGRFRAQRYSFLSLFFASNTLLHRTDYSSLLLDRLLTVSRLKGLHFGLMDSTLNNFVPASHSQRLTFDSLFALIIFVYSAQYPPAAIDISVYQIPVLFELQFLVIVDM